MTTRDRLEAETTTHRAAVWRFSGRHRWWMWCVWPRHASNDDGEHGHSRWRWLAVRRMRRTLQRLDTEDAR